MNTPSTRTSTTCRCACDCERCVCVCVLLLWVNDCMGWLWRRTVGVSLVAEKKGLHNGQLHTIYVRVLPVALKLHI